MFNRSNALSRKPPQQPAQQPEQPQATSLAAQPSSSSLSVRPPRLGQRAAAEALSHDIPPMPLASADHLKQGFSMSVDQSPDGAAVTAVMGSVQPRGPNVRAAMQHPVAPRDAEPAAPRDAGPGALKRAAQAVGRSFSGGVDRLRDRLRRGRSSPSASPERAMAVSAPTLVAAPQARRFTQQDVLLRVDVAVKGGQQAVEDLATLNLDSATREVSHLATGNGTFRRLATALKIGSQLIDNEHDYDVPAALRAPLTAIADFYKRPDVARHVIAAGDVSGWAREGEGKIEIAKLRELAHQGGKLLRELGKARDSLASAGTGERASP